MVSAIAKEIVMRKNELPSIPLETIYFGGGTPSILTDAELGLLFETIAKNFDIRSDAEITLEANPDDLTAVKIRELRNSSVNRLSIGVQSFDDKDLKLMNRAHNASEAERSIKSAQDAGLINITADLIYGLPEQTRRAWQTNIEKMIQLEVPHLSSYCLTVEPKTALAKFVKAGKIIPSGENVASDHFDKLVELTELCGYEHYEISNFAKEGYIAIHNSSYWKGKPYLGVGPSAHSYDGKTRRWNVANNMSYLKSVTEGKTSYESETLTLKERYNERVMLGLRAKWGVNLADVNRDFGSDYANCFRENIRLWVASGDVIVSNDVYTLSKKGKLLADRIASSAFYSED
ncbi:MAG: Oxygen-independent coproporphyrinogen-III oxidase [Bacteroidota bacterium]|jgi:oxygen-independent coproporphyrinogen-3 oxidase